MEMYDWLYTANAVFNGKLVNELFDAVSTEGPIMVVLDGQGNMWASEEAGFAQCNIDKLWLENLCTRVADGSEPVVSNWQNCGIILSALRTERRNTGYLAIILPEHSPEATLTKLDLSEMVIGLANRLATILEQNEHLHEIQNKLCSN